MSIESYGSIHDAVQERVDRMEAFDDDRRFSGTCSPTEPEPLAPIQGPELPTCPDHRCVGGWRYRKPEQGERGDTCLTCHGNSRIRMIDWHYYHGGNR